MAKRLGWFVVAVVVLIPFLAWRAFQRRVDANSDQLARDLVAAEAATYERPVHREPARDGSFTECVEALVPQFKSIKRSQPNAVFEETVQLCLGELAAADLSDESKQRLADFRPLRPMLTNCLHEARVTPGTTSRFARANDPVSATLASMGIQMQLSNCSAVIDHLQEGNPNAALAECADSFAWFRDAALSSAGERMTEIKSMGFPLLVPCGVAINAASNEERASFARELKTIRGGLLTTREAADRRRLWMSFDKYKPFMSADSRAKAAKTVAIYSNSESFDPTTVQLQIQANWSTSDRLLREAIAEVEKPRSPERTSRLAELSQKMPKEDLLPVGIIGEVIREGEAREAVDAALELLIAAAEVDIEHPQPLPASSGFSAVTMNQGIGFKLLVPKPTPVLVLRTRPGAEDQ